MIVVGDEMDDLIMDTGDMDGQGMESMPSKAREGKGISIKG